MNVDENGIMLPIPGLLSFKVLNNSVFELLELRYVDGRYSDGKNNRISKRYSI